MCLYLFVCFCIICYDDFIALYVEFCKCLDLTQSVLYESIRVVAIPLCMSTHAFLGKGQFKRAVYNHGKIQSFKAAICTTSLFET